MTPLEGCELRREPIIRALRLGRHEREGRPSRLKERKRGPPAGSHVGLEVSEHEPHPVPNLDPRYGEPIELARGDAQELRGLCSRQKRLARGGAGGGDRCRSGSPARQAVSHRSETPSENFSFGSDHLGAQRRLDARDQDKESRGASVPPTAALSDRGSLTGKGRDAIHARLAPNSRAAAPSCPRP